MVRRRSLSPEYFEAQHIDPRKSSKPRTSHSLHFCHPDFQVSDDVSAPVKLITEPSCFSGLPFEMENNTDTTTALGNDIRDASSPFDDSSADIIFRSCDNVDFHVHTIIMSLSSPFFSGMFTLTTTSSTDSTANTQEVYKGGLPIVPFPLVPGRILRLVLLSCYAIHVEDSSERDVRGFPAIPTLTLDKSTTLDACIIRPLVQSHLALPKETSSSPLTLDEFKALASTLDRCDISGISDNLLRACVEAARADPAVAYAYAYKFHFDDMKMIACRLTLEKPLFPLSTSPELDVLSVSQYSRLLQYHRKAELVASRVALEDWSWMTDIPQYKSCRSCITTECPSTLDATGSLGAFFDLALNGPGWLFEFVEQTGPHLKITPCSFTVRDPARLEEAFKSAIDCKNTDCIARAKEEVRKFSEKFALAVDRAVAKVRAVLTSIYICS